MSLAPIQGPAGLHAALNDLLEIYSAQPSTLSAWESHCLGAALTLLRFGYYNQARGRVQDIFKPPFPLPAFAAPRLLTVDDIRRALALLT